MIFTETQLKGAYIIEPEKKADERGFFARTWCQHEFEAQGLNPRLMQCNISYNAQRSTLRGMHYQAAPYAETKLVRCTRGAIHDVIIDLRPDSATYRQYITVLLDADNYRMLYIPEGFAHGFQTLEDDTEVFYQMSAVYNPKAGRGVRWDDPAFSIDWPQAECRHMSDRDRNWPDFAG